MLIWEKVYTVKEKKYQTDSLSSRTYVLGDKVIKR